MRKSVFVLGAGASIPYGYPSGADLIKGILSLDGDVDAMLRSVDLTPADWSALQTSLRFSAQPSIDAFLERRSDFKDIGKLMIAANILRCEDESKLFTGSDDHWYPKLLAIFDGPFESLDFRNVTVVTFNYDRSLEQFLHLAICNRYKKSASEVALVLESLKLIHVYGQVGKLQWEGGRRYASRPTSDELRLAAQGIRIISECEDDTLELQEARTALREADEVFCLGMAYHSENMRRLGFPITPTKKRWQVSGSAFDLTDVEKNECQRRYGIHLLGHRDHKCANFLRNSLPFQQIHEV